MTLSIKEQIFITIVALTSFCVLVILGICCTLVYEFFKVNGGYIVFPAMENPPPLWGY